LRGPQGATGPQGPTGPQGSAGGGGGVFSGTGYIQIFSSPGGGSVQTTTPVTQYYVSPSISSVGTVTVSPAASTFTFGSLNPSFNPIFQAGALWSVTNYTSNSLGYRDFGSNILFIHDPSTGQITLSQLSTFNLGVSAGLPTTANRLISTIYLSWY